MSNAKAEQEDLKKLEDEAYLELCQIIAEAMQYQDITILDQRIVDWKKKYKKLLDSNSSASKNFKKRIEYLLNEYYSEITQYILKQIRKTEQKRIENQSKVLRKLYYIIKETDDLTLLEKKVKEWEDKYPISGFLNMYQKRIKIYTSEKYLKENAFDQDMAFRDLYYITKLNRTYDELKEEVKKWEDTYSIHDKFELDDFIKNQSAVNRYTSDEYLKSIAHSDNSNNQEIILPEKKATDSSLPKQAAAYSSLMSVARKPNNIDEIFDWVYKYNYINFNDEYKSLIMSAIYNDYSPTYLNSLSIPKINLSRSLSFEEYQNIDEIKRYAVISYFNLLLPPEKAIPNNYFNEYIEKIYNKSKSAHFSKNYDQPATNSGKIDELKTVPAKETTPELEIDISDGQTFTIPNNINISKNASQKIVNIDTKEPQEKPYIDKDEPKLIIPEVNLESQPENFIMSEKDSEINVPEFKEAVAEPDVITSKESQEFKKESQPLSSDTIIATSPLFFEIMNNKVREQKQQVAIVTMINNHVEDYISSITPDKTNDISKTINNSN